MRSGVMQFRKRFRKVPKLDFARMRAVRIRISEAAARMINERSIDVRGLFRMAERCAAGGAGASAILESSLIFFHDDGRGGFAVGIGDEDMEKAVGKFIEAEIIPKGASVTDLLLNRAILTLSASDIIRRHDAGLM